MEGKKTRGTCGIHTAASIAASATTSSCASSYEVELAQEPGIHTAASITTSASAGASHRRWP